MADVTILFACGHQARVSTKTTRPFCDQCGETRRRRVEARAPRFRGTVRGPSAETVALDPIRVGLGSSE